MVATTNRRPRPTGIPRYFTDSSDASSTPRHVSKIPKFHVGSNNGQRPRPNNNQNKPKPTTTTTERLHNWVLDGTGSVDSNFLLPPRMVDAPPPLDLASSNNNSHKKECVLTKRRKFEELMAHMVSKQRSSSSDNDSSLPPRSPKQADTSNSKFHQLMASSVSSPPNAIATPLSPYSSLKNSMLGLLGANHNIELDSPVPTPKRRRAHCDTTKDRLQSLRQKAKFGLEKLDHHTKATTTAMDDTTSVGISSSSPSVSIDLTGETETSGIYDDVPHQSSAQSYILGSCSSLIDQAKKEKQNNKKEKGSKGESSHSSSNNSSSRASRRKKRQPIPPSTTTTGHNNGSSSSSSSSSTNLRRSLELPVLKQHAVQSNNSSSNTSVTSSPLHLHLPMSAKRSSAFPPPLAQQLLQLQQKQKLPKDPTERLRSFPPGTSNERHQQQPYPREPAGASSTNNSTRSSKLPPAPNPRPKKKREPTDSREWVRPPTSLLLEPSEHVHELFRRSKIGNLLKNTLSAAATAAAGMIERKESHQEPSEHKPMRIIDRKESQEPSEHLPSSMRSSIVAATTSSSNARQKPPSNLTEVLRRRTTTDGPAIEPRPSQEPSEHLRLDPTTTSSRNAVAATDLRESARHIAAALEHPSEPSEHQPSTSQREQRNFAANIMMMRRDDRQSLSSRRTAAVHKRQLKLSASSEMHPKKLEPSERLPSTAVKDPAATKETSSAGNKKEQQQLGSPSSSVAPKKGNRREPGDRRRAIGMESVAESLKQQKAKLKLHKEQCNNNNAEPSERLLRIMAQKDKLKARKTRSQLEPSSRAQSTAITGTSKTVGRSTIACSNSLVGGVSTVESNSGQTPQTEPPGSSPTANGSVVIDLSVASPEVHASTVRINVDQDSKTQGSLEISDDNSIQIIDTTSWGNQSHGHDPTRPLKLDIGKEGDGEQKEERDENSNGTRRSQTSSNASGREGSPGSGHAQSGIKIGPSASQKVTSRDRKIQEPNGPDPHGYLSEITSHGGSLHQSGRPQHWAKSNGMHHSNPQSIRQAESREIPGLPQRQYSYDFHEVKDSDDAPTVICVLDSEQEENSKSNAGSSRQESDPFAYIRRNIFKSKAGASKEGRKKISTFAQDMKQGRNLKESLRHLRQASKQKKKDERSVRSKKPVEDEEIVFVFTETKDDGNDKNSLQKQEVIASEMVDKKKKQNEGRRRKPPLPEALGERMHFKKPSGQLHLEVTDAAMTEARDEREQSSKNEAQVIRAPLLSPITLDDQSTASSCTSTRSDMMTAPSSFSGIVGREIQCCDDESGITDSMAGMSLEQDKVERRRASHCAPSHEQYGVYPKSNEMMYENRFKSDSMPRKTDRNGAHGYPQATMTYEKLSKGEKPKIPRPRSPSSPTSAKSGIPQQITSLLQSVGTQLVPSVPSGLLALSRGNLSPTGPKWAIHKEHDLAEEVKNMTESMANQLGGGEAQSNEKNVVERKLRSMEERIDIGQGHNKKKFISASSRDLVNQSSMQSGHSFLVKQMATENTPKVDEFYFMELQTKLSDFGSQVSGALQEHSSFFPSLYKVPQALEKTQLPHSHNQASPKPKLSRSHRTPGPRSKASSRKEQQVDAKLGLPVQFERNRPREVSSPPLNVAIVDSSPIISKFLKRKDRICQPNRPNSKGGKQKRDKSNSNAPGSYCYSYDTKHQNFTIENAMSGLTGSTEKEQRLANNQTPPLPVPSHPFQDFAVETKRMADNFQHDEPSETFSKENQQKKELFGRLVSPLTLPTAIEQKPNGAVSMQRGERYPGQGPDEATFERKETTSQRRFVKKSIEVRRKPCLPPSNIDRSMLDETSEYQSSAWSRSGVSTISSNRPSPLEDDGVSTLGASTQTQTESYASTFMTSLVVKDTILVKMSSVSESVDCTSNSNNSASEGASHSTPSSSSTPLSERKLDPPSMGEYHAAAAYHAAATCSQPFYAPVESTEEPYNVQPSRSQQEALSRGLLVTPSPLSNQFSVPAAGPMTPSAQAAASLMSDSDEASESSYYFAEHNDQVVSGPSEQHQQQSSPMEPIGEQTDSNESSGNMLKKLLSGPRRPKWKKRTNEKKVVGPPPSSDQQKKKREPSVREPSPQGVSTQDPSTIQEPSFQGEASFQEEALTAASSDTDSSIVKGEYLVPEPHQLEERPRYYPDPMPRRANASERNLGRHQQDIFEEELARLQSCIDCVDPPGLLMDLTGISFGPRRHPVSKASSGENIDNVVLSSWNLQNRMDKLRANLTFSPNGSEALSPHANSASAPAVPPHATNRKNLQTYESAVDSVMEDADRSARISCVSGASFATFSSFDELSVSRASRSGSEVHAQQALVRKARTMDTERAYVRGLEGGTPKTMTKFRSKSWRAQDEEEMGNSIVASNSSNSRGYYGL